MPHKTLRDYMRESTTDPYLKMGPRAPQPGWVYRDFHPMPNAMWDQLMQILGEREGQVSIVGCNVKHNGSGGLCRAQIFISEQAQMSWNNYMKAKN